MRNKRVIAVIPARGGSKGVAGKNLAMLGGRPLVAWPIAVSKATASVDRIIVSTDSEEIAAVAREYGAEVYVRPAQLATDTSAVADTIRDLRDRLVAEGESCDVFVLLEGTSPFRTPEEIEACLERMGDDGLDSIATFAPAHTNPHRVWKIEHGMPRTFIDGAVPWLPRQKLPEAYELTGTVYAFAPMALPDDTSSILYGRFGAHVVDAKNALDIDTETDLRLANVLFESSCLAPFK